MKTLDDLIEAIDEYNNNVGRFADTENQANEVERSKYKNLIQELTEFFDQRYIRKNDEGVLVDRIEELEAGRDTLTKRVDPIERFMRATKRERKGDRRDATGIGNEAQA